VLDWGIGFDPGVAIKRQGLGLMSMKERMKLSDGELSIESYPSLAQQSAPSCFLRMGKE
jgi:signal transduction histidine kinase